MSKYLSSALLGLLASVSVSFSQTLNNNTNLYIPSGMEVHAPGNVMNSGFMQNNGVFAVRGDWMNSSIYQGTGTITLEGTNQKISNNNQSVEHLAVFGGGTKIVQGKLSITQELEFGNGMLLVNNVDTLLMRAACEVKNASSASYVVGALTSEGTGYKFYPVGRPGKYHPVELTDVKGIDPVIEVKVMENLPAVKTSLPANLYTDIYWVKKTIAGTYENSPVTVGYSLPSSANTVRTVFAESATIDDEFSLISNPGMNQKNDITIIGSVKSIPGNVFAIGELLVDPPQAYYLSTTLSPNALNPENRLIKVFGDNVTNTGFYFQVFNRWGLPVYETQSLDHMKVDGWDGRQHGTLLSSGVYPYSIKYINASGQSEQRTGFITIIN